jgi:hypothetical protein
MPSWVPVVALAAALCFVTFFAKGGLNLQSMTVTEMALTLAAGVAVAIAVMLRRTRGGSGIASAALLLVFALLTAISIAWSVAPAASWTDAGRMLAYAGVFAASVAMVKAFPGRWSAVLGGVTLAAVTVCTYALATKVFPDVLAPADGYARLEEPYGYWNAIGLTAAMGAVATLWLGARRDGHALLRALAYPAMGLLLLTLALAYSRGALAALAIGALAWLAIVPLRLRAAAVLGLGGAAAAAVAAWGFSTHALSADNVGMTERVAAGHRLGVLIVAMLVVLGAAGVAIGFETSVRAPSARTRRRAGAALLALVAVAVLAFAGALAHSRRGFTGSISHAVSALTDPNARTPPNTPGRLTAVASVRARYWKEALQVFAASPVVGAGAMGYQTARLRYRRAPLVVAHAHGFVVQTLADLGLIGLAVALALLATWMAAAGRATHPFNRRWAPWSTWRHPRSASTERPGWWPLEPGSARRYSHERVGLLSMLAIVITFGAHSLVDWTWYVPGDACVALLCAGWLAGRGELAPSAPARPEGASETAGGLRAFAPARSVRAAIAAAAIVAALLIAWSQWQPQRSEDARQQALELAATNPAAAVAAARTAVSRNPLSPVALFTLADLERLDHHPGQARATLEQAVREQPAAPQTWLELGRFDLATGSPLAALRELQAAIYLDPESIAPELLTAARKDPEAIEIYNDYIEALRRSSGLHGAQ